MIAKAPAPYPRFPCVVPMWDNSPRRGSIEKSVILHGSTPEHYERWLEAAIRARRSYREKGSSSSTLGTNGPRARTSSRISATAVRDLEATRRTLAAAGYARSRQSDAAAVHLRARTGNTHASSWL